MKKDIEWLKEELDKTTTGFNGRELSRYEMGRLDGYTHASMLLDELDEPETLNEEWINEHSKSYTMENSVEISDLKNLLLPQPKKPVIPKFVADWIDTHNLYGNNPLREYRDLENDFNEGWTDEEDAAVYHWVNKNPYTFIDALRYGYEVEKEPQWVVRYEDGYFSEEIKFGCGIDGDWVDEVSRAYHFTDKAKAEAVALLIGGTVEEATE